MAVIGCGKCGPVAALVGALAWSAALAAQSAPERALAAARATYEDAIEKVRAQVIASAKKNADLPIKERQDRVERFKQAGTWPDEATRSELAPLVAAARAALDVAYGICLEKTFEADEEFAKTIRAEWDQWSHTEDMLTWIDLDTQRLVRPAGARWPLPIDLPGTYRLEIAGKARPGTPVRLVVPGQEGTFEVELASDQGQFHAILTFGPDSVLAIETGGRRTVAPAQLPEGEKAPILVAEDAAIDSLRYKEAPLHVVTQQEITAALSPEVFAKIQKLEGDRRSRERDKGNQEKRIQTLTAKATQLEQAIARVGPRADASDLRADLATCRREIRSCQKRIDGLVKEIADIEAKQAELKATGSK